MLSIIAHMVNLIKVYGTVAFLVIIFSPVFAQSLEDREVQFMTHDSLTLSGTLSLPMGPGPHPVAILIHGSGPSDRNERIVLGAPVHACLFPDLYGDTLRPFRDLADHLQLHGMAVLRYDKRTTPPTVFQLNMATTSVFDFEQDVVSALAYLGSVPEVDTSRTVLIGHSQGTNFAPRLAARLPQVKAVVVMGTPTVPLDSTMARQLVVFGAACGDSTQVATMEKQAAQVLAGLQNVRNNPEAVLPVMGAFPSFWRGWLGMVDGTLADFAACPVPVLALQGVEDLNVTMEDARRLEAVLLPKDRMVYFEGVNHYFTPMDDPYVPHEVLGTISHWLKEQGLLKGH